MPEEPAGRDPLAALAADPAVTAAVTRARAEVDDLSRHRLLRRRAGEVAAEATLRSARASAALAGVDIPLDDLRRGPRDPLARGAVRAAGETGALLPVLRQAPRQALARLHVLVAGELAEPDQLGRPRTGPEPPDDSPDAPPAAEAVRRLAVLCDLLAAPTSAPALVVAAVAHGELLTAAPFPTCNGVVARAVARMILVGRGLDPRSIVPVDVGHLELQEGYVAATAAYRSGDLTGWVGHCADAVVLGVREGRAVCEALARG